MMRKLFFVLALFLGTFTLSAQKSGDKPFVGIWQLCDMMDNMIDGSPDITRAPHLKIFTPGGSMYNLMLSPEGEVFLTMEGSYEKKSDSSYVEHIKKLLVSSAMDGKDNTMRYEFINDDLMILTFKIVDNEGKLLDCQEVWQRVSMPLKK